MDLLDAPLQVRDMTRVGTCEIDEVLPFAVHFKKPRNKSIMLYGSYPVYMDSQRYWVFKNSLSCARCGLVGKFFALEKYTTCDVETYHFNLYAVDKCGNEVLMTKDHIVPKSYGGKNTVSNYQTMCIRCNEQKGDWLELPLENVEPSGSITVHFGKMKRKRKYNTTGIVWESPSKIKLMKSIMAILSWKCHYHPYIHTTKTDLLKLTKARMKKLDNVLLNLEAAGNIVLFRDIIDYSVESVRITSNGLECVRQRC